MNNRYVIALSTGALLGVVCIFGALLRYPETVSMTYVFSFWFNRLVMGAFYSLIPSLGNPKIRVLRGLGIGLFISFAFFSSTEFFDIVGFFAGGAYGVILENTMHRFDSKHNK